MRPDDTLPLNLVWREKPVLNGGALAVSRDPLAVGTAAVCNCRGTPSYGGWIECDAFARELVGLPAHLVPTRKRAIWPKLLDEDGLPVALDASISSLRPGLPMTVVRGHRWERGGAWTWSVVELLLRTDYVSLTLRSLTVEPPRRRGWDCAECDEPTTGVVDLNGRDVCMKCWTKTQKFKPRPTQLRCPVTNAPLDLAQVPGATQGDMSAWCSATRSLRNGPCTPECERADLHGWLTASGRFKLPDGTQ